MLGPRIKTGAVLSLVVLVFLWLSRFSWILFLSVITLSAMSAWEFGRAVGINSLKAGVLGGCVSLLLCFLPASLAWAVLATMFLGAIFVFARLMHRLKDAPFISESEKWFLCLSIPVLFSAVIDLRQSTFCLQTLTLGILVCALTDTFAFFVGRKFGRTKLAPILSPKKTREGAIGGTLIAIGLLMLLSALLELAGICHVRYDLLAIYVLPASMVGQYGDLCLSCVKRTVDIKDYGKLLPGHGGLLDRLDSQLLTLPFTYLFICCFGSIYH